MFHDHREYDSWGPDRGGRRAYSPPHIRYGYRTREYLSPEPQFNDLHRSRSQGHVPRGANIHIHNEIPVTQDTHQRADSRPPPMAPPFPQQVPMMPPMMQPAPPMFVPVYPEHHHHHTHTERLQEELLAEQIAAMRLNRSRSRGRTTGEIPDHHHHHSQEEWYKWQLMQHDREAQLAEQARLRAEESSRLKTEYELETAKAAAARAKQEAEAIEARKRIIEEHDRRRAEDAQKIKDAEAALKLKMQLQASEEREREKRAYEDFLHRQREEEAEEERQYQAILQRQKEKAAAEEKQYRDFLLKQKEKEAEAEKKKKEEQAKVDAVMKERLEKAGYSYEQIQEMLDPEKAAAARKKREKEKRRKHNSWGDIVDIVDGDGVIVVGEGGKEHGGAHAVTVGESKVPVYPRIHRKYLDVETLEEYRIPWEWDRANTDFIIILSELDKHATDFLFEHTANRRRNKNHLKPPRLMIEDSGRKKEPKYAWIRHKSRERSKSRGRDLRVIERRY